MRIACTSDLHGHFPKIPECDLLLLGGDYCPMSNAFQQQFWFKNVFANWLTNVSQNCKIIGVAGNHEVLFEEHPELVPQMDWTYLQDSGIEWNGFNIWGSPWQPRFYDWAFNADEPQLKEKWDLIPVNTDILILHGPPRGYGDFSPYGQEHTGSPSLLAKIEEIQPKLVIAGHIHAAYGKYQIGNTIFLNCSLVDEKYKAVHDIHIVNL